MQEQGKELIQVVVAVGSSRSRLVLDDLLNAAPDITSAHLVTEADDLVQLLLEQRTDVVLLDNDLLENQDMLLLKRIFSEAPTPVLLLVTRASLTLELVKQATELGVYAIICKEGKKQYPDFRSMAEEVYTKVRAVRQTVHWDSRQLLAQLQQQLFATPVSTAKSAIHAPVNTVIVVGASTGGTQAVETLVKALKPELAACLLVAVHLPKSFTRSFARRLQELTPLQVVEGRAGLLLKPGQVVVAPGGRDMLVMPVPGNSQSIKIGFAPEPSASFDLPSVDLLMQSVAESAAKNVVGVILTGMGSDGTVGAGHIRRRGGLVIAQDEASSLIFGMARSVIERGEADAVLPLPEIPLYLNRLLEQQAAVCATGTKL